jgi:flagellar hook-basal body complex protein FliE
MAIDTRNLEQMLSELRAASAVAQGGAASGPREAEGADFSLALKSAIDQVNAAQQQAQQMTEGFAAGNDVNLQDVMINLQKASLSFQQMVQVRNKLVTAYQDVMNMPV